MRSWTMLSIVGLSRRSPDAGTRTASTTLFLCGIWAARCFLSHACGSVGSLLGWVHVLCAGQHSAPLIGLQVPRPDPIDRREADTATALPAGTPCEVTIRGLPNKLLSEPMFEAVLQQALPPHRHMRPQDFGCVIASVSLGRAPCAGRRTPGTRRSGRLGMARSQE